MIKQLIFICQIELHVKSCQLSAIYLQYFQVVIRPMMYIALTYDHRLIDGREAVTFLRGIKRAVEDPRVMFLDL